MSLIIVILILILIFKEPVTIPQPIDDSGLKKEIISLQNQNDSLSNVIENTKLQRDTVLIYKDSIRNVYHETIKYINTSSTHQLDSIIRSNWD
jgi:hypothetical protein